MDDGHLIVLPRPCSTSMGRLSKEWCFGYTTPSLYFKHSVDKDFCVLMQRLKRHIASKLKRTRSISSSYLLTLELGKETFQKFRTKQQYQQEFFSLSESSQVFSPARLPALCRSSFSSAASPVSPVAGAPANRTPSCGPILSLDRPI